MKNIYDFLVKFKTYLNSKTENDFWIDPKHTPYGNLLIKSLSNDKRTIFKPIDSTLSIGSKRIRDFIVNTPTFKKNSIDNYIFIARRFKENAIKFSKSNKQLTLITFDFGTSNIELIGSEGLDQNILKVINEFSEYFDSKTSKNDRNHIDTKIQLENKPKLLINTERTHRENEEQLYFLCPLCGVNLSIPRKYRKHDELKCYNCHVTFKNPMFYPNDKTDYNKIDSNQNKSLQSDESMASEQLSLIKKQNNWFFGIIIFVIILIGVFAGIFHKPNGMHKKIEKSIIEKHEIERNPKLIYSEIKKALTDEYPGICENLFNEMQAFYSNSILFDSVKIIYDSAMNIVQLKIEETRKNREKYRSKELKKSKSKELKKFKSKESTKCLYGEAGVYSDGVLSCNIYLYSNDGKKKYYLDATSISYKVLNSYGSQIMPIKEITTSKTKSGLFIDIPLGNRIYQVKSVSFVITTSSGATYKLNNLNIVWD